MTTLAASTTPITLVSFALCPYVQRAAIVLAEKNVPFTRIDVDLDDKPDWFRAISPLGKVPLLQIAARQARRPCTGPRPWRLRPRSCAGLQVG